MTGMVRTYLSLGSNMGRKRENLHTAIELLENRAGQLGPVSRIYESEPWGYQSERTYFNCCVALDVRKDPGTLMQIIAGIEREMGRMRTGQGYMDRPIDIDILLYGDRVIDEPGLKIPHPRMEERRFVLAPLSEIAPDAAHPISGLRVRVMLDRCRDPLRVVPLEE